jgi:type II secretory pathway pseudopilin PulG
MTLLELLLVMGLMAILLGAGVGILSGLDLGRRAAVGSVQNAIRAARNSSLARNAPARVRIDVANATLVSESMAVIGTWHFENDRLEGAFGLDGVTQGAVIVDQGFVGKALSFAGGKSAWAEVPVQNDPSYDLSLGFALDCAVRVDEDGGGTLLRIGESVGIDLAGAHSLRAWFVPEIREATGGVTRGGKLSIESDAGALQKGRWTRVHVEYDRTRLMLALDDVEVARLEATAPVWRVEGPLSMSDREQTFPGLLDNLVISAVAASDELKLPDTVRFGAQSAAAIHFDAGGNLDRGRHTAPVQVVVEYDDNTSAIVRVGMYGTVE